MFDRRARLRRGAALLRRGAGHARLSRAACSGRRLCRLRRINGGVLVNTSRRRCRRTSAPGLHFCFDGRQPRRGGRVPCGGAGGRRHDNGSPGLGRTTARLLRRLRQGPRRLPHRGLLRRDRLTSPLPFAGRLGAWRCSSCSCSPSRRWPSPPIAPPCRSGRWWTFRSAPIRRVRRTGPTAFRTVWLDLGEQPSLGTLCEPPPPPAVDVLHGPPAPQRLLRGDGPVDVLRGGAGTPLRAGRSGVRSSGAVLGAGSGGNGRTPPLRAGAASSSAGSSPSRRRSRRSSARGNRSGGRRSPPIRRSRCGDRCG